MRKERRGDGNWGMEEVCRKKRRIVVVKKSRGDTGVVKRIARWKENREKGREKNEKILTERDGIERRRS